MTGAFPNQELLLEKVSSVKISALAVLKMFSEPQGNLIGIQINNELLVQNASYPVFSDCQEIVGAFSDTLSREWVNSLIQLNSEDDYVDPVGVLVDVFKKSLSVYKISPEFLEAYKSEKFGMEGLGKVKQMLCPIPFEIDVSPSQSILLDMVVPTSTTTSNEFVERHVEYLSDAIDDLSQEVYRWQGWQRMYAKEHSKLVSLANQNQASNDKVEKANKESDGSTPQPLPHTPEECKFAPSAHLLKLQGNEPSRLESCILNAQIDAYCSSLKDFIGLDIVDKVYADSQQARSSKYNPAAISSNNSALIEEIAIEATSEMDPTPASLMVGDSLDSFEVSSPY